MSKEDFSKIKLITPVSVIIHSTSEIGYRLSKTLAEQGSKVILIDDFNALSKKYISELKKVGDVDFIDIAGLEDFFKTINRVDYIYYCQYNLLTGSEIFSSREFLQESNNLNIALKAATKNHSKFELISTIELNKKLADVINSMSYVATSPYSSLELQKYSETLTAEYHDKSKANVRIVRIGTVLGTNTTFSDNPTLKKIFEDAVTKDTIEIQGDGLETHYIISEEDAVYGLLKLCLSEKTNGEVVSLCNTNEYTTLSVAYKILELNPNATEIKFLPESEKHNVLQAQYILAPNATNYGWEQTSNIEEIIKGTLDSIYKNHDKTWKKEEPTGTLEKKLEEIKETPETRKPKAVRTFFGEIIHVISSPFRFIGNLFGKTAKNIKEGFSIKKLLQFIFFTIVFGIAYYFFIGPIITLSITASIAYAEVKSMQTDLSNLNFEYASDKADTISFYLDKSTKSIDRLKWVFTLFKQNSLYDNTSQLIYSAKYAADGASETLEALIPLASYIKDFQPAISFQGEAAVTTREYREYLKQMSANNNSLNSGLSKLAIATKMANDVDPSVFPWKIKNTVGDIKIKSGEISAAIEPLGKIVAFLPDLLGKQERKQYLILLENPSEIRSTGGWISSYAIVGIEGGQVRELSVDDVYNAEGLLKVQGKYYDAPASMKQALDVSYWSFSLSNWEPDFAEASEDAAFFVKETGKTYKIDGVIVINMNVIQELLKAWGGLEVTGETEKITSDNLYSKMVEIHNEFIPGQSVKSTFLANLANAVLKKLLSSNYSEYSAASNAILQGLDRKDILAVFSNRDANSYFIAKNWSGKLIDSYKSSPTVVDWNWGGNKANLYVKENMTLNVDIVSETEIKYTYNLSMQNTSQSTIYPEGDYKDYMRIYLPEGAVLHSVKGYTENDYDIYYEGNYKILGGWFNVPINNTKNFELVYTLQKADNKYFPLTKTGNTLTFDLNFYKQPGALNEKAKVEISYPDYWLTKEYGGFSKVANQLSLQGDFYSDIKHTVSWEID